MKKELKPLLKTVSRAAAKPPRAEKRASSPVKPPSGPDSKSASVSPKRQRSSEASTTLPHISSAQNMKTHMSVKLNRVASHKQTLNYGKVKLPKRTIKEASDLLEDSSRPDAFLTQKGKELTVKDFLEDIKNLKEGKKLQRMSVGLQFSAMQ